MKNKSFLLLLIIQIIFVFFVVFSDNHSQKTDAQTCGIDENFNLIKVGISTNDFSQLEYGQVSITAKGAFEVVNKQDGTLITSSNGNEVFTFKVIDEDISIYRDNVQIVEFIYGPIAIIPEDAIPLEIVGLKRAGKQAIYRGELDIVKSPTKDDKLSVVNILPLDEYLKGVVPNEMPPNFGLEALKAQAVAARNYAIKPRVKPYRQFDICDSVACQVYFGYNTEHPKANQAIEETKGLVGLYHGEPILALYSSTAGGYTENYENAFNESGSEFPSLSNGKPYLKGVPDINDMPILDNEESARLFYTSVPSSFEAESPYFRWTREWTQSEIEAVLNKTLSKNGKSPLIFPQFAKTSLTGKIKKIEVLTRGVSGKAMIVRIKAANGEWTIKKENFIRKIFENSGKMLPSANFIVENIISPDGSIEKFVFSGGGLGHGVGMSQFGANFMSKNNYSFDQILQHYYSGISLGTNPAVLTAAPTSEAVNQRFYSPDKRAVLFIDNSEKLNSMKILLNSNEIIIPLKDYNDDTIKFDIETFLESGINDIIYFPPKGDVDGKAVKIWVEVYKAADAR
jgi:SpoIID/LytB domain protein